MLIGCLPAIDCCFVCEIVTGFEYSNTTTIPGVISPDTDRVDNCAPLKDVVMAKSGAAVGCTGGSLAYGRMKCQEPIVYASFGLQVSSLGETPPELCLE